MLFSGFNQHHCQHQHQHKHPSIHPQVAARVRAVPHQHSHLALRLSLDRALPLLWVLDHAATPHLGLRHRQSGRGVSGCTCRVSIDLLILGHKCSESISFVAVSHHVATTNLSKPQSNQTKPTITKPSNHSTLPPNHNQPPPNQLIKVYWCVRVVIHTLELLPKVRYLAWPWLPLPVPSVRFR